MNYSFIIPHKNVPSLLNRLLNTIPDRNDTEIIIVDDHSDPNIVDFTNFPGKDKKNTSCIYLDASKGAGYARNIGITRARGKWLLFADADDFYTENIIDILDAYKDDCSTDIVYLNAQSYFEKDGKTLPQSFSKYFDNYIKHRPYAEKVLRYNIWTPWSRMVKQKLVMDHNIRYEEIPVGNDKMFCLLCSKYAKQIAVESQIVYNYYVPEKGSVTRAYSDNLNTIKQRLELQYRANQLYKDVNYLFKQSYLYGYYRGNLKDKALKTIYKEFMKKYSISKCDDVFNMVMVLFGKLFKII